MYCIYCGKPLPEDGTPCPCRAQQQEQPQPVETDAEETGVLESEPVPVQSAEPQPVEPQPVEPQPPYVAQSPYIQPSPYVQRVNYNAPQPTPYGQPSAPFTPVITPVHGVIKAVAGSPLFLVGAILASVNVLISIIQSFMPVNVQQIVYTLMQVMPPELRHEMDFDSIFYAAASAQPRGVVSVLLSMLPGLVTSGLMLAALWITYASGRSQKSPLLKTSGLTILKVLQTISLVALCLCAFVLVVLFIIFIVIWAVEEGDAVFGILFLLLFLAMALMFAPAILYIAKIIGTLNTVKRAVDTGSVMKKASVFVAVMNFIFAGFGLLSLPGDVLFGGWLGALSGLIGAATQVVFGVCILQFNKQISALPYGGR